VEAPAGVAEAAIAEARLTAVAVVVTAAVVVVTAAAHGGADSNG
jgi:hypothetical protein